jgi:alkylhydroperoxidase family enzyme
MGFLNKVMDAVGVELEPDTCAETLKVLGSGWSPGKAGHYFAKPGGLQLPTPATPPSQDGIFQKLYHLRYVPGAGIVCITLESPTLILPVFLQMKLLHCAVWLEYLWTRQYSIPSTWPQTGAFLKRWGGCDWPVMQQVVNGRVAFAICAMLRENLDASTSVIGLQIKPALGIIYARVSGCKALGQYMHALQLGCSETELERAARYADDGVADNHVGALWQLARVISPSPAQVSRVTVEVLRKAGTTPAQIVEVVCWISVLQMIQRLIAFYPPKTMKE